MYIILKLKNVVHHIMKLKINAVYIDYNKKNKKDGLTNYKKYNL